MIIGLHRPLQNPEDASAKADGVAEKPAPPAVAEKPKQMPAAVDDMPVQPRVAARMSLRQRKSCTQVEKRGRAERGNGGS